MTRGKKLHTIEQKKKEVFKQYKSWKRVYCPVLKNYVHFTLHGWKHILNKKYRSGAEKMKRLTILPNAREVIKKAKLIVDIREKNNKLIYEIIDEVQGVKMSILIIKVKKEYVFLSIFKA